MKFGDNSSAASTQYSDRTSHFERGAIPQLILWIAFTSKLRSKPIEVSWESLQRDAIYLIHITFAWCKNATFFEMMIRVRDIDSVIDMVEEAIGVIR